MALRVPGPRAELSADHSSCGGRSVAGKGAALLGRDATQREVRRRILEAQLSRLLRRMDDGPCAADVGRPRGSARSRGWSATTSTGDVRSPWGGSGVRPRPRIIYLFALPCLRVRRPGLSRGADAGPMPSDQSDEESDGHRRSSGDRHRWCVGAGPGDDRGSARRWSAGGDAGPARLARERKRPSGWGSGSGSPRPTSAARTTSPQRWTWRIPSAPSGWPSTAPGPATRSASSARRASSRSTTSRRSSTSTWSARST